MPVERRGQAIHATTGVVNRQREEPTGCDGERQLSMDGTSRVSREAQARICERLGVRFPGATRPRGATPRGYSTGQVVHRELSADQADRNLVTLSPSGSIGALPRYAHGRRISRMWADNI